MRRYETTYVLRPNLGEDQFTEVINRTNANIEEDGAVINIDRWGLKKLAYEIKKETQGYYICVDWAGTGAVVAEMERIFRIDERVIRFLTIKLADSIDQEAIQAETEKIANQAAEEAEGTEDAAADKTATDKAVTDKAVTDKAATDKAATDKAATDEAATDKAATDEAATDEAATDEAAPDDSAAK